MMLAFKLPARNRRSTEQRLSILFGAAPLFTGKKFLYQARALTTPALARIAGPGDRSLLLELPVPFRMIDGILNVEAQAYNGLERWLDNFDRLTVCAPVVPDNLADSTFTWRPVRELLAKGRLELHKLPWAYQPLDYLRHRAEVRKLFRQLIAESYYLCFCNLGWSGAWGHVAASEARRVGRPYAIWLDWVLHTSAADDRLTPLGRSTRLLRSSIERQFTLQVVRNAELGLFHGQTVYDAYAPISRHPYVVHDVHLKPEDLIDPAELERRLQRADGVVRIGYAGRLHPAKGPFDWVCVMAKVVDRLGIQCEVSAIWMGEGPLLTHVRDEVARHGLQGTIRFPGAESDRRKVVEFLRSLDIFAFCHNTPESPRCLLEALISGIPIVGYRSTYAEELVEEHGGGEFVDLGDSDALADAIVRLATDDRRRRTYSHAARRSGARFSDDAVFAYRSDLIKRHL